MRIIRLTILSLIVLAAEFSAPAYAGTSDIQMLPPLQFDNVHVCGTNPGTAGILMWGGVDPATGAGNPINCIPGFTGDSGGNIFLGSNLSLTNPASILSVAGAATVGTTVTIGNAISGVATLDHTGVTAAQDLAKLPDTCKGSGEAIVENTDGSFNCALATTATGTTAINVTCPAGQVLDGINGGTASCVTPPSGGGGGGGGDLGACTANQVPDVIDCHVTAGCLTSDNCPYRFYLIDESTSGGGLGDLTYAQPDCVGTRCVMQFGASSASGNGNYSSYQPIDTAAASGVGDCVGQSLQTLETNDDAQCFGSGGAAAPPTTGGPTPTTCAAGQALTWNGSSYSCISVAGGPTPPTCDPSSALTWNGSSYSCIPVSGVTPTGICDSSNQTLQWNGSSYSCATVAGGSLPACSTSGDVPYWTGSAWSCEIPSGGSGVTPTGVCTGSNVLQWNGSAFTCAAVTPSGVMPTGICDGANQTLQWTGSAFACGTVSTTVNVSSCSSGYYMSGISSGTPVCVALPASTPLSLTCPANEYIYGVSGGTPLCAVPPGTGGGGATITSACAAGDVVTGISSNVVQCSTSGRLLLSQDGGPATWIGSSAGGNGLNNLAMGFSTNGAGVITNVTIGSPSFQAGLNLVGSTISVGSVPIPACASGQMLQFYATGTDGPYFGCVAIPPSPGSVTGSCAYNGSGEGFYIATASGAGAVVNSPGNTYGNEQGICGCATGSVPMGWTSTAGQGINGLNSMLGYCVTN